MSHVSDIAYFGCIFGDRTRGSHATDDFVGTRIPQL